MISNTDKSKKNKQNNIHDKVALWNIFDSEIVNPDKPKEPMECLYRTMGDREMCERCDTSLAYSDEGFLTCTNDKCGIIYKDMVDRSPEWRFYGADDSHATDPTRCGMPINPLLEESSFGCRVLCAGKSSYAMRKIRRYTEWQSMPYKEKALYEEFQRMTIYAQNAGYCKKIIDDSIYYHKKLSEYDQSFRGDNKQGLLIGAMSISCKVNKYPRTAKELATTFHVDVGVATHGCKTASSILNQLEKDTINNDKTKLGKTKPEDFIERYCSKLNINRELTNLALFISKKIDKHDVMPENTPHSIASGIIYFIAQLCNLPISKKDIKNISEISEVTINKCAKKMEKMTDILVPKIILDKYNK